MDNGSLVFSRSNTMTVANAISGSGSITQSDDSGDGTGYGCSTLILTGNNTFFTGATVIEPASTIQVGDGGTLGTGGVSGGTASCAGILAFNCSDPITVANVITGSITLVQQGTGTLTVTGTNNTYTGGTTISAGTLQIGRSNPNVLPNGSGKGIVTINSNGTLDLNGYNLTLNGLGGSGAVTSNATGVTSVLSLGSDNSSRIFPGVIRDGLGNVALTIQGSGTLTLTGTNGYSGTTTINAGGTLQVGNWSSTGSLGSGNVVDNGSLVFSRSNTMTVANAISGSGSITQSDDSGDGTGYGCSTLILTGNNTFFTGATVIEPASTIQVGDGGTLGTGGVSGGTASCAGILAFNCSDPITVANVITGSITLVQQGTGTLTVTGTNNTYTGGTTIDAGSTLQVGAEGTAGILGPGNIVDNGLLVFDHSDAVTISNSMNGTGTLAQQGTGVLALDGTCSLNAATIGSDTLRVDGSLNLATTLTNQGTLLVAGTGSVKQTQEEHGTWGSSTWGSGSAFSGTELALAWTGFGSGPGWTYTVEGSLDADRNGIPDGYFTIATCTATDSRVIVTGLKPDEPYYLRLVATDGSATEIYDAGRVTTFSVTDPNVPQDISAWYRVTGIHSTEWDNGLPAGTELVPRPESASYTRTSPPPEQLPNSTVQVFGESGPLDVGSFEEDNSWFYANSPQAAVLEAVQGLVTDGSLPTIDASGRIVAWHIEFVDDAGGIIRDLGYTFDASKYPSGAYGDFWQAVPYTFNYQSGDPPPPPPCPSSCGCSGAGGGPSGGPGSGPPPGCGSPSGSSGAVTFGVPIITSPLPGTPCTSHKEVMRSLPILRCKEELMV